MKVFLKEYYNAGHEHSVQLNRWNNRIDKDYNELKGGDRTLMKLLDFAEKLYLENQELKKINNYEYNKKLSIYGIDMPYKTGKLKGELTSAEIRRLVSAHNRLSKIQIPKGTDRNGLIKLVESNGFRVDHKNEKLIQTRSKPLMKIDLPPKKTRVKKESTQTLTKEQKDKLKKVYEPFESYASQFGKSAVDGKYTLQEAKSDSEKIKKNLKDLIKKSNLKFSNEEMKSLDKRVERQVKNLKFLSGIKLTKKGQEAQKQREAKKQQEAKKLLGGDLPKENYGGQSTKAKKQVTEKELYPDTRTPQDKKLETVLKFMNTELKSFTKSQNKKLSTEKIKSKTKLIKNMFTQITKNTKSNTDLPSKLMRASEKLLNLIYSNPPNPDKVDGVVLDFKSPALKGYKTFLSSGSIKKNRNTLNSYKPKKPPVKKEVKKETSRKEEKDDLKYRNFRVDIQKRLQRKLKGYEMRIEEDDETNPTKEDVAKFIKSINEMIKKPPQVVNEYIQQGSDKKIIKKDKQLVLTVDQKKELNKLVADYEKDYNEIIDEIEEEEEDEEPEEVSAFNDDRLTEVRKLLRTFIKEKMKEFKEIKKPTMKDVKKFNRSANKVVRDYEQKNNIEFTGKAGDNLYDITSLFFDDMKFLVK